MPFVQNIRARRNSARANRALDRAIRTAPSQAVHDELLIAAQRAGLR